MATILEYLNRVDSDAKLRQAHLDDPRSAMKAFGLSDEQCEAVISGDQVKMAEIDGLDSSEQASIQVPHTGPGPTR